MIKVALGQLPNAGDEWLRYAVQLGCQGVIIHVPDVSPGSPHWRYDDLAALRERVESFGLELLSLENTPWTMYEDAMIGGPRRDEQIDSYCTTVANMGRAGIGVLGFCWMPALGYGPTDYVGLGRGGVRVRGFDYSRRDDTHLHHGREYTADEMWENFDRFINTVAPVAEESGVRLALHPDDPPVPTLVGVARIFGTFEAFRRATEEVCASPAFGLNFCMGTWSEMGPGVAMHALDYFAQRGRVVYLHFRDVKGHVPQFEECFLGEGNIDPLEPLRILKRAGYEGFLQDDHVPMMDGDETTWAHRGRAWSTGYILGLLHAVDSVGGARTP